MPATSIGLGAMLGAGIFVFPGLAGGYAGFAAIISFLIGGIIALLTAACTAELATAMPQSGGGYFFISRSFGTFWGTITGISQWVGLIFACAFYLVTFGKYALTFLQDLNIGWDTNAKLISFCFVVVLLIINIIGTKKVSRFQNMMVITLTIILVLIFSYGIIDYFEVKNKTSPISELAPAGTLSIFTTTALIFTSYLGFVQIANIGAEIKKPSKNLSRSLIGSVLIAMGLYIFIMTVCVLTFSQEELKQFGETATIEVARKIVGNWGNIIVLFAGLLAALSSANASIISASRGVFALSKDRVISKSTSKINTRFGTPHIALIFITVPVAVLLFKSSLEVFAEVASFLHLIIYAGICFSVLKLRTKNPAWYIPSFRIPAAKWVATIGALSCLTLAGFMQKESILISIAVLFFAIVYYLIFVRRKDLKLNTPKPPHIDAAFFNPNVLIPVAISEEKKEAPKAILEALPDSNLLLLGFKEIPEQTQAEQSEEEFGEEAEAKLAKIRSQLEDSQINFDTKLIFSDTMESQLIQFIDEADLQFILTLKPLSELNQIAIPIFHVTQINRKLSTILYTLQTNKSIKIFVYLFLKNDEDTSSEESLKRAIEKQFGLVGVTIHNYKTIAKEKTSSIQLIQNISEKTDLVVWSEPSNLQRDLLVNIILEKESVKLTTPTLMILNKE